MAMILDLPASGTIIMNKRLGTVAIMFLVYGGILVAAELICRLILPHPAFYAGDPGYVRGLYVTHPVRTFAYAPHFSGRMTTADFDTQYSINALGLRDAAFDVGNPTPTILAVGDSFTVGWGVEQAEAWPARLQAILATEAGAATSPRVVNAGVSGYSLRQIRLTAAELIPVVHPRLIIAGVFARGHTRLANPFVLLGDHLVLTSEVERLEPVAGGFRYYRSDLVQPWAARIDLWMKHHFHFGAHLLKAGVQLWNRFRPPGPEVPQPGRAATEEMLRPLLEEIAALQELAQEHGSTLIVLLVAMQPPDGRFRPESLLMNDVIADFCAGRGIRTVDPLATMQERAGDRAILRFANDGHWTAMAHEMAAAELAPTVTGALGK
jgi:hypothetical protein